MSKSVFLDKIVTSMHRPRQDGSTGFVSTTCFPDLSHTQITTDYCPQPTTACTPLGQMTQKFRVEAHRETRSRQRPISELVRKPKFFRRAHNVFANKVLLDLENVKRMKNYRRQQIWETGKADYGFEGLEDSFITQTDGLGTASMYQEAGFNNLSSNSYYQPAGGDMGVIQTGPAQAKQLHGFHEAGPITMTNTEVDDEYADEGFDNFQYADDFNPEMVETVYPEDFDMEPAQVADSGVPASLLVNSEDAGILRPGTSAAQQRVEVVSAGQRTASSSASLRFSSTPIPPPGMGADAASGARPGTSAGASVSRGQTQQEHKAMELYEKLKAEESVSAPNLGRTTGASATAASSSSKSSKKKKKKKKHLLPPARKRRAFNRSTFFELLLDTMEVPDPHAPRFGMLRTSPSRQGNRSRSPSPIFRAASQGPVTDPGAGYMKPHTATDLSAALSSLTVGATGTLTQTATGAARLETTTGASLSSNQEQEAEDEPVPGDPFDKWEMGSVKRAMTGDRRTRAKDYR